jgi:acyl-CoA hydrolase
MTVLMTPDMVNFSGKVHGGVILKLLDQVVYAYAAKYSKNRDLHVDLPKTGF